MRFQRSLLAAVHPMSQTPLKLSSQLTKLEDEKLIRLEIPAPKWEYNFHNMVVQEVVYEGLLLAQRRQLHKAVGDTLEELVPEKVERLAYHYSRSDAHKKAFRYLRAAGEKARREYANLAAIDYHSALLSTNAKVLRDFLADSRGILAVLILKIYAFALRSPERLSQNTQCSQIF